MELEQRVKALEYELKILKNEIQRTLLDIQEQVLIHYYPALRSEDSTPPADAIAQLAKISSASTAAAKPAAPANVAAPASTPAAPITTKKVSLDEIRSALPEVGSPAPASPPRPSGSVDQVTMVKLLEWVNDSMAKLGGGRTSRLIEICVTRAILDGDTQAILSRLTSLNKEAGPEHVAANDVLNVVLKLDETLGRAADIEEALTLIEEANLG
jgi:hypothetical protein